MKLVARSAAPPHASRSALRRTLVLALIIGAVIHDVQPARGADQPPKGKVILADLGGDTTLELMSIPPGEFMSGSTPAERAWATGIEGGATPGTARESYEGEPQLMRVKDAFWMGDVYKRQNPPRGV